jgi:RHS repeat-associated protein
VNATQQFTYDSINRLTAANEAGGWSQAYNYDAFGNLTGGAATGIAAAFPGSISATNNRITDPGWSYDPAGNVTVSPAANSIAYDAENRQVSYTPAGLAATTYVYDGEGRRVQKIEQSGPTSTYVYDAMGQLAAEYDTGGSTASGTQYLTADYLGSTRLLTDTNGAVVACHDYQPFGAEIPSGTNGRGTCYAGTDNPKQKFTGKERDAETGLDYFGARYFSGAQGGFTSPDWSEQPQTTPYAKIEDPQTLNLYGYLRNNPLSGADPDGHCDWCQQLWNGITGNGFQTDAQLAAQQSAQSAEQEDTPNVTVNPTTTVKVDITKGLVVQAGVNSHHVGGSVSYVPSTGAIYGTGSLGTPGNGANATVGLTTDPNQAGPSLTVSSFNGIGWSVSVTPTGEMTASVGAGTSGASGASVGLTKQIGSVPPARVNVTLPAIPAQSAIPIGDGLYTYEDWPQS